MINANRIYARKAALTGDAFDLVEVLKFEGNYAHVHCIGTDRLGYVKYPRRYYRVHPIQTDDLHKEWELALDRKITEEEGQAANA